MASSTIRKEMSKSDFNLSKDFRTLQANTTDQSSGFHVGSNEGLTAIALYIDCDGRTALLYTRPNTNWNITILNGTFVATAYDKSNVYLRVGNYVRAMLICICEQEVDFSVY